MSQIFLILILTIFSMGCAYSQLIPDGPYKTGWTSVSLNRDGRNFSALIYYPAFNDGSDAQIDTINGPYQPIAFGHGFFMQNSYYISILRQLASHGFVVIAPQFYDVNHLQLGYDMIFCLNYLKKQSSNPLSKYYKLIDTTKSGVSGHSMGGGASLLASSIDTTITVSAPLAAAETNPSAINTVRNIKGVVYLISAQNDGITPVNSNQLPMYNNSNPVKALLNIKGANHTKFMDTRIWDWTDPNGYLSPAKQIEITRKYLTAIFKLFLKEDPLYYNYAFGDSVKNDTSIIFTYVLKPLNPKKFKLIYPLDTLYNQQVTFIWNSTTSINLEDTVRYHLLISNDSTFVNSIISIKNLKDTTYLISLSPGRYFWKVRAYTSDSTYYETEYLSFFVFTQTDIEDLSEMVSEIKLYQNFPNPFNAETVISWKSKLSGRHIIKIFDITGKEIQKLLDEDKPAGLYQIRFYGNDLPSGQYFYSLIIENFKDTRKMMIIK